MSLRSSGVRLAGALACAAVLAPASTAQSESPGGFTDLGFALAGAGGEPVLVGSGDLSAASQLQLTLSNAAHSAPAGIFLAVEPVTPVPFRQGTLVPFPFILAKFTSTGPAGEIALTAQVPPGLPTGLSVVLQWAIVDAGGPAGVALSNALQGVFPHPFHSPARLFADPMYPTGQRPTAVAVGDFNADGVDDLVVSYRFIESTHGAVLVRLGVGGGLFGDAFHYAAGVEPSSVACADFDNDGDLDLAVTNYESDDVSVLLGAGDGSFGVAQHFPAGAGPYDLVTADMNGDGSADLAITNNESPRGVSILLGDGAGSFAAPVRYPAGAIPTQIVLADMNLDGIHDFVINNNGVPEGISVVLGAGDGSFDQKYSYLIGTYVYDLTTGDVDGDDIPDVIFTDGLPPRITVVPGRGDGTLFPGQAQDHPAGLFPWSIQAADMDGDGRVDIVLTSGTDAFSSGEHSSVAVLRAVGDGSFEAPTHRIGPTNGVGLAISDLDADGALDVATAHWDVDQLAVYRGVGDGTLVSGALSYTAGEHPSQLYAVDLNLDGFVDLLVDKWSSDEVESLLGLGGGSFAPGPTTTLGPSGNAAMLCADFDGDDVPDLVRSAADAGSLQFWSGVGDGTFTNPSTLDAAHADFAPAAADLDLDGILDLVATGRNPATGQHKLYALLGAGDGSFAITWELNTVGSATGVALADFDGDGVQDLAVPTKQPAPGHDPPSVAIHLGLGDGTFGPAQHYTSELFGFDPDRVLATDLNGDGLVDLFLRPKAWTMFGAGAGGFDAPAVTTQLDTDKHSVVLADLDHDGLPDLVTRESQDGHISVRLGDGTGDFGERIDFFVGNVPAGLVCVADFDDDGLMDAAVSASGSNLIWILLNQLPD